MRTIGEGSDDDLLTALNTAVSLALRVSPYGLYRITHVISCYFHKVLFDQYVLAIYIYNVIRFSDA